MDDVLSGRWEALTALLGVEEAEATRALRDLWRRYDEPHRAYHRLPHIRHVLEVVDLLRAEGQVDDPVAVQLAAWYHDAVYDAERQDNEARSATLAAATLTEWDLPPERVEHVEDLVLATATHRATTADAAALVDADLAILAADPATYDVYRRSIRVEHDHLDEAAWARGRGAFLQGMLRREHIFTTAAMQARGERRARENLAAELDRLA